MSAHTSYPQDFKLVTGTPPVTTNGGVTCDYVSLKNINMAWIEMDFTQAVAHATVITINKATAVAGTGVTPITSVVPIWLNDDTATTDTLVAQTAAVNFTLTADTNPKKVVFQIDPASLVVGSGFDCIGVVITTSGQATNFVNVNYILDTSYKQATPPAAITD